MVKDTRHANDDLLLRGATLWLLMALLLAWGMVGLNFGVPGMQSLFAGKFTRLLQAHLDFLLMSALLFGFHAARVPLPGSVRWAMVIGAFSNSSLFLLQALFPQLDTPVPSEGLFPATFRGFVLVSITVTSYGFGRGAAVILRSTLKSG